jgi:glycine hydroxymethyltransferase
MAHVAGLVAAGLYPSPVQIADLTTSTTHKTLRGPRSGLILGRGNEALEKKVSSAVFPGIQGGPLMHVIAAKAVAFKEAMEPEFRAYQRAGPGQCPAMAETFLSRGFKSCRAAPTTTVPGRPGPQGPDRQGRRRGAWQRHITVNKNSVPNDPQSPFVTSGLRIGTPAMTTRGFGVAECEQLAGWLCDVLDASTLRCKRRSRMAVVSAASPRKDFQSSKMRLAVISVLRRSL